MKQYSRNRRLMLALTCAGLSMAALTIDSHLHGAIGRNPFGAASSGSDAAAGGVVGWLLAKQSEFYLQMSSAIRAAKADGAAAWGLMAISFAYGIFHAAGPGHGKAVIASYLIANEETARRGIVLSFASATLQSMVAVAIVGVCAWVLDATASTMCGAERTVEIASYLLISAFALRLVWSKGNGFARAAHAAWTASHRRLAPLQAFADGHEHLASTYEGGARHDDAVHRSHARSGHGDSASHDHHHDLGHVHDDHCGHAHGPVPGDLGGPGGWKRGLGAVIAVGVRPCSGAILVLVFALAQGMFWAGVAATLVMGLGTALTVAGIALIAVSAKGLARRLITNGDGGGALVMRGLEFGAACLLLIFGAGLLLGYVAAERVTCF